MFYLLSLHFLSTSHLLILFSSIFTNALTSGFISVTSTNGIVSKVEVEVVGRGGNRFDEGKGKGERVKEKGERRKEKGESV
ncbi:hypothetical protein VNO78_14642 [Psophocarpus tetragonolobus]|uniref:Transmembrane protein n=1 Tax=Psophocarpus tetragonolobus TaxID=3891 RepID=A0AAN9XJ68_PSOTE